MENKDVERLEAFKRGIHDVRNGVLSDLKRELLKQEIINIYGEEQNYPIDILMKREEQKQKLLDKFERMDEAYREGMEMATLHPEASIDDLVNLKMREEEKTQKTVEKIEETDQQSSEQKTTIQNQTAGNNKKRTVRIAKAREKRKRYAAMAGALAAVLTIATVAGNGGNKEKEYEVVKPQIKVVTTTPTPEPTTVPLATKEPIPTPTPTPIPDYYVTYNTLQDWYSQNSNDTLFKQIFGKYFVYGDDNNMTIGDLEKCFEPSYFDGMILEYEVYKAKSIAIEKGADYMENFARDLVKYKVLKAIGDPNVSMDNLKTISSNNHTVNYTQTEMVKTIDGRYVFSNSQLPKEIREIINGNGIVQLSNINEYKTSYCNNMVQINSGYNTMKNAWGLALEIVNKDYRVQGSSIKEAQKDIEVER